MAMNRQYLLLCYRTPLHTHTPSTTFLKKKIFIEKRKKNFHTRKLNSVLETSWASRESYEKREKAQSEDAEQERENLNLPDKGGLNIIESRRAAPRSDSGCDSLQLAFPPPYTLFHKPSRLAYDMSPMLSVLPDSTC